MRNMADFTAPDSYEEAEWAWSEAEKEWRELNAAAVGKVDVTPLDAQGQELMRRLRLEYAAPRLKMQRERGGEFQTPVVNGFGETMYKRPPNIWDELETWIDGQKAWCEEHDVALKRNWRFGDYDLDEYRRREGCLPMPFIDWLIGAFGATPTSVEHLINAIVTAYVKAHKVGDVRSRLNDLMAATANIDANAQYAAGGVAVLVGKRKKKVAAGRKFGKQGAKERAETDAHARAMSDRSTALGRVRGRMKRGESCNEACKHVCDNFGGVNVPLMDANGKPLKYESLARYYRESRRDFTPATPRENGRFAKR